MVPVNNAQDMNNQRQLERRKTRTISVGNVFIGSNYPVTVQSMTNTDTRKVKHTVEQIKNLEIMGCDLVRLAVPDMSAAQVINQIKKQVSIPLIADIHFDYRLALEAIKQGVDGLRINPGNIGSKDRVKAVVDAAQKKNIPIRIGVNAGSLEKGLARNKSISLSELMVESALKQVKICEDMGFFNLLVSLKASDILTTVKAYRLIAQNTDLPLHLGITEAGTIWSGTIKSAIGIGTLLLDGIGDTIRISLTGDPVEEVRVGKQILKSLGLRKEGVDFISCPTCGRCEIDLISLAKNAEAALKHIKIPLTIAVMGCVVNGPGEAREADLGIAGGKGEGLLFRHGQILRRVPEKQLLNALLEEVDLILQEKEHEKEES